MILLFDIGNTHTHVGLANGKRVLRRVNIPTASWSGKAATQALKKFVGRSRLEGAALCSVVPARTPQVKAAFAALSSGDCIELTHKTDSGVEIDYPRPATIGPDRLANAVAAKSKYGSPSVVVDFGTAVTFDVVNRQGAYAGGVIAPGISAMTDYLHEKTALLPRIELRDTTAVIGKNTEQAMQIGAVHGYRGLIREIISEIKRELKSRKLPVVATGGCARLIAKGMPEITAVDPLLTLEGLRLVRERNA
ncbi:MAG: type III pantothenate kinase [Limisphaerales bacterium]|jgi:type III pantothenate kinase